MSIYNKKLRLPKIDLKMPQIKIPSLDIRALGIAIIIIIILLTVFFISNNPIPLNNHIYAGWTNNPLNLGKDTATNAELHLVLINNSSSTQDINLEVTTESKEIIIFCPDNTFPRVASGHRRETTCSVRRNPSEKIYSGTYAIIVKTNLGQTTTSLEVYK